MKSINKRVILLVIATVLLFVTLQIIRDTYAKYVTENEVRSNVTFARWRLKVNNQDIIENEDFSETLELQLLGNDYAQEGALVPGAEGYVDLILDTSITDLSCNYTITATPTEENTVEDMVVTGYSIDEGTVSDYDSKIEGSVLKGTDADTRTIRIFFKWKDGESGEVMNDVQDTKLATIEDGLASYLINIVFEQNSTIRTPSGGSDGSGGSGGSGGTGDLTLAAVTNDNIGDYIDLGNNVVKTTATTDDWRIFYVEDDTVYAILSDYLPASMVPESAGLTTIPTSYPYSVWSNINRDTLVNGLKNETAWSNFTNGIAGARATGTPTAELLMNSYNTKNGTELVYTNLPTISGDLYVPHTSDIDGCYGYWLASPYAVNSSGVWYVGYDGFVYYRYNRANFGARPVVSLPSNITAELLDGIWKVSQ